MQDKHGLLTAPINQVLRTMTIPMVFGMFAILMFNLVDTFFISLLGTQALAAISFTFPITFGVNCITMGIGMGISTSLGRLLGQGLAKDAARFTCHGLILAIILICIASSIGLMTMDPLFHLLGAEPSLLPLIKQYMHVWYLTIPLLVIPMAGNSAIRATGDTKTPAKIMMIAGLLNGLLDPLLIFGYGPFPELGIQGAAIASALSWLGALSWALYILIKREKLLAAPSRHHVLKDWRQILSIGTPAAFSSAMAPLSGALLMSLLAAHGTAAVAAYGAAQRIESILLLVLMSLTSVLSPFLSQNIGAQNTKRSQQALFTCIRFSFWFQLIVFMIMVPLSIPLAALFSQEHAVQNLLWHYLLIVPLSYGFQGIVMMVVSCLNAMHQPLKAFSWNFVRLFGLLLPCAWLGSQFYDIQGLFIGIMLGNIISGIAAFIYAKRIPLQALSIKSNN